VGAAAVAFGAALGAGCDSSAMVVCAGTGSSFGALGADRALVGGGVAEALAAAGARCMNAASARCRAAGTMATLIAAAPRASASTHQARGRRLGATFLSACMK
jgi:hypothetical protein